MSSESNGKKACSHKLFTFWTHLKTFFANKAEAHGFIQTADSKQEKLRLLYVKIVASRLWTLPLAHGTWITYQAVIAGVSSFQDQDSDASLQALQKARDSAVRGIDCIASLQSKRASCSARPLYFTSSRLVRWAKTASVDLEMQHSFSKVLTDVLLSQASIYRHAQQLEKALAKLEEARSFGTDVSVMQKALLDDISRARKSV